MKTNIENNTPWRFERISPEDVELVDAAGYTTGTFNHDILDTEWVNKRVALIIESVNQRAALVAVADAAKALAKFWCYDSQEHLEAGKNLDETLTALESIRKEGK